MEIQFRGYNLCKIIRTSSKHCFLLSILNPLIAIVEEEKTYNQIQALIQFSRRRYTRRLPISKTPLLPRRSSAPIAATRRLNVATKTPFTPQSAASPPTSPIQNGSESSAQQTPRLPPINSAVSATNRSPNLCYPTTVAPPIWARQI
ncbi:hypothetical protein L484_001533 [Morus notabilis]|uniref:Uncharacterized protein n=1 Tax=Morus notabilis TaxID=981085 RepID=W9S6H1_9ROSA|nr:hypothetical protein L484_001533 [Morus notabilis]